VTDESDITTKFWRRPVDARDPHEPHRVATSLELLFDLCFVVVVAYAARLGPVLVTFLGFELWLADRRYRRQAVLAARTL
jgi:low temperature requirement protein LtrA